MSETKDDASRLRHALRGSLNAMKLGLSALELGLERGEELEFLEYLIQAADKLEIDLLEFEALPEAK